MVFEGDLIPYSDERIVAIEFDDWLRRRTGTTARGRPRV
jgi:hypothetical protein